MSNNDSKVIGKQFRDAVAETGGCPSLLPTERGSDNGIMYSKSIFLLVSSKNMYTNFMKRIPSLKILSTNYEQYPASTLSFSRIRRKELAPRH